MLALDSAQIEANKRRRSFVTEPEDSSPSIWKTLVRRDSHGTLVELLRWSTFYEYATQVTLLLPGSYTVDVENDRGLRGHAKFDVRKDRVFDRAIEVQLK